MRKNIDVNEQLLVKLKLLAVFEKMSVKSLMEKAISFFVEYKEKERFNALSDEEKEDIGLLLLMQESNKKDTVSKQEITNVLDE